ncbi:MAG TPA: dihydrolipoamide acetyltransferase family protein [Clostridium sp.]|uniref:dihydrolipoamide acetyltransferase family protein n=1 Tax=Clostridium sp. TaxID=1506 RepID=UPI002F92D7EC
MAKVIVMPKLGMTMKEGTLTTWNKKEGDTVEVGESLFHLETDKLSNEVESNDAGVVRKLLVQEGDIVECLVPIAIIASADEDISSILNELSGGSVPEEESNTKAPEKKIEEIKSENIKSGRIKASPAAKKIALENNIDITLVEGTGPQARITIEDVDKYIKNSKTKPKVSPVASKLAEKLNINLAGIQKNERIMKEDVLALYKNIETPLNNHVEKRVPMSQMRKIVGSRMHESWLTSPRVTFNIKIDTTSLKKIKNALKDVCKVTYTDLLVKIVSKVLLEYPLLNCSVDGEELILRNYVNIGVAVGLDDGLMVPVIKYANEMGLEQISANVKDLVLRARNNKLTMDELTGGTFTITNIGMYGIESFSPIINQPEVAILGVNKITETPVVENGEIVIKPLMNLSLTADHRAVDGSVAAQFLAKLKVYIEKPELLFL